MLEAPSKEDVQRQLDEVAGSIEENASAALEALTGSLRDATAVLADRYRRHLRTLSVLGHFIQETRCREKVIRTLADVEFGYRLARALSQRPVKSTRPVTSI